MHSFTALICGSFLLVASATPVQACPQPLQAEQSAPVAAARNVGTLKSITGNTLVLKSDSGPDVTITLQDGTRIVRLAPGQTDLKGATPMTPGELQAGDRILVRGKPADNNAIAATSIVVMKQSDVAQKQQQDLQDWQKRGTGGIVHEVDAATGIITVSVNPTLTVVIRTAKDTGFLRYSPDSIKFSDAQKGTIEQIKSGDQLRARGSRSADGKELTAEEVISGAFRNIAGTITFIDTGNNSITVKDILARKSVVVKFNSDSQLRKLAPQMAQRLAFFLKGGAQGGPAQPASANSAPSRGGAQAGDPSTGPGGPRPGGGADFQQMLGRIPSVTVADLQKEDAVMIVATQGTGDEVSAITLLGGVEPILTASPNGSGAAALFSGWNLSAPGGEGGGPQ